MREEHKRLGLSVLVGSSLVGSFLHLLAVSWFRWGELVVDTFREAWVPAYIAAGHTLYRDVLYEYGFLPPYLVAGLYKIFGVHLNVLAGCGMAITAGMSFLLYRITCLFLDTLIAGLTTATFLFVFAFGYYYHFNGLWHFVLPYSFASTLFILFVTLALYGFLQYILRQAPRDLWLWAIALCCAFLSRIELTGVVWVGFVFVGGLVVIVTKPEHPWKLGSYLLTPFGLAISAYALFFAITGSWANFRLSFIKSLLTIKNDPSNLFITGLFDLPGRMWLMGQSLGVHLVLIGLLGVSGALISMFFLREEHTPFFLLLGGGGILCALQFSNRYMRLDLQYRCLPILLMLGLLGSVLNLRRGQEVRRSLALLTVFVIGLAAMFRILLNATCIGYGFFMLDIGLIGYYLVIFGVLPQAVAKYRRHFSWEFCAFLLIGYFVWQIHISWAGSRDLFRQKSFRIETPRGTLFSWDDARTQRFNAAIQYLRTHTPPDATVVALPEGVGLNFLAQRDNPSGFYSFHPPVFRSVGEENLIVRFAERRFDYIVIVQRATPEYGQPFLGIHYGQNLMAWIADHYRVIQRFGPHPFTTPTGEFGIAIYQRQ